MKNLFTQHPQVHGSRQAGLKSSAAKLATLTLCSSLLAASASAEVEWSGFASIIGGKAMGDDYIVDRPPNSDNLKGGVSGYGDEFEFATGSLVALQGSSNISEKAGVTVQIMSRGIDEWKPEVNWAYVHYDFNDEWRLLAGLQRAPLYMFSDFLDVSYAYHWIEPTAEVYGSPFSSFNGLSLINTHDFGNSSLTSHFVYGDSTQEADADPGDGGTSYKDLYGAAFTYNYNWLTLRGAYFTYTGHINCDTECELPAPGDGTINSLDFVAQVDINDWLIIGEFRSVDLVETGDPNRGGGAPGYVEPWYFSVAKRLGDFTPHATVGRRTSLNVHKEEPNDFDFYTIGLRWDFDDGIAFKVDYSSIDGQEVASPANGFDPAPGTGETIKFGLVTVF